MRFAIKVSRDVATVTDTKTGESQSFSMASAFWNMEARLWCEGQRKKGE
jgi:hypothetical protein